MAKVVPIKESTDESCPQAAGQQEPENWFRTVKMEADDLAADVRDARTVVAVATETWGEENGRPASSCVGVLDLLDHKLSLIECAVQKVIAATKVPPIPKARRS